MSTPTGEPPTPWPNDRDPAAPRPAELPDPSDQPQPTTDATPADDESFVALLKRHFPWMLHHPGRRLDTRPNLAHRWIGLSAEDAYQDAILKLLKAHRNHAPGWLKPEFIATSISNARIDLWRRSKSEGKVLTRAVSNESTGDANQPDDLTDEQLRAAVLEHRWHLDDLHQQVIEAVFDPAAPTLKAIAERVGRSPSWVTGAMATIGNTIRQCLIDENCPGKERD